MVSLSDCSGDSLKRKTEPHIEIIIPVQYNIGKLGDNMEFTQPKEQNNFKPPTLRFSMYVLDTYWSLVIMLRLPLEPSPYYCMQ